MGTPWLWTGFLLGVLTVIAIDLRVAKGREITPRLAAIWTGVWISLSLGFAGLIYFLGGSAPAFKFLTAYVVEYALSVDNLFVFIVVFAYFRVALNAQHRLLYWGILGAFVMRGALIALGTQLVTRFEWILYFFGAFLLWTGFKLLRSGEEAHVDPEKSPVLKWARRVLPVSERHHGLAFFAVEDGKRKVTLLFLVLLVVEATDLLFALDSIPAVLGISQDPFLIFSSNACAILGLRSLFFLVESLMSRFRYLKVGLGVILSFVGVKLGLETYFVEWARAHEEVVIGGSLSFVALTLVVSIVASTLRKGSAEPASPAEQRAPEKSHV